MRRILLTASLLTSGLSACGLGMNSSSKEAEIEPAAYYLQAVAIPKAVCQPGDSPETGLQGQLPVSARGPNKTPFNCNLEELGSFKSTAWATLDMYKDCAYYGLLPGVGGTQTVSVTDTPAPGTVLPGVVLHTAAMTDPWESLRVHAARGLLAAGGEVAADPVLDIYDVSVDCRAPILKASMPIPGANGHEGWFSPDGMTYWMSGVSAVQVNVSTAIGGSSGVGTANNIMAVDVSNPTLPVALSNFMWEGRNFHGGWMSDDGNRGYWCIAGDNELNGLLIVDTSDIQSRKPNPKVRQISYLPIPENNACQSTYRVTYRGRPYVIVFGEMASFSCTPRAEGPPLVNYAIPVIVDVADELNPKIVSRLILEVDLPEHCDALAEDGGTGFTYDVHHCSPDRLHDPTILACGVFQSGLRVFDIRDPYDPKELAYYNNNTGAAGSGGGVAGTSSRPVIRTDRGEIWFTNDLSGFHVVKFENGVWPFRETPKCSGASDWLFKQQNPTLECP